MRIDSQKVVEIVNVNIDDTKLPTIQKEDSSDSFDVEDLFDDEDEPKVVPDGDNGNDPYNVSERDMVVTVVMQDRLKEATIETTCHREESMEHNRNNSKGAEQEQGSTTQTQKNIEHAEVTRSYLSRQRV